MQLLLQPTKLQSPVANYHLVYMASKIIALVGLWVCSVACFLLLQCFKKKKKNALIKQVKIIRSKQILSHLHFQQVAPQSEGLGKAGISKWKLLCLEVVC